MTAMDYKKSDYSEKEEKLLDLNDLRSAYIPFLLRAYKEHKKGFIAFVADCKVDELNNPPSVFRATKNLSDLGIIYWVNPFLYESIQNHKSFLRDNPGMDKVKLRVDPKKKSSRGKAFVINPNYWGKLEELEKHLGS